MGEDVDLLLPRASRGNPPLTYSVGGLPSTLDFSPSTRRITGTPSRAATHTVTYSVRDDDGDTDSETFTITIEPAPPPPTPDPPELDAPPTPDGVSASTINQDNILLSWDLREGVDREQVRYRIKDSGPWPEPVDAETIIFASRDARGTGRYTSRIAGLDPDTTYEFEVQSYGDGARWQAAWGPWSGTVEDTTFPAPTLSIAVPDGGLEADGSTDITVNAGELAPTLAYRLSIATGTHTGFDDECAAPVRSVDLPVQADRTSYAWPLTLHGCSVGTDTLTARLYEVHEENDETERATAEEAVGVACPVLDFGGALVTEKSWTQNTPITPFTLPEASGGCGDLTHTLNPDLPSGVQLSSSTRRVSGTPTAAMARTEYTWTARDTGGAEASLTFYVTAPPVPCGPTFGNASVSDQSWKQNTRITPFTLPRATGENCALTYTLNPDLPSGVQLSSSTRRVSGTPTAAMARTEYTWTARDTGGAEASLTFYVTVPPDLEPTFGAASVPDQSWRQNVAITPFNLPRASGGDGTLTHTLSPDLPSGVTLNANTRQVSGTPTGTMDETGYTWTAEDEDGDTATLTFDITVALVPLPPAPDGVSASTINQDNILLSWDLREGIAREKVRYQVKDSDSWTEVDASTIIFASRTTRSMHRYESLVRGLDPDTAYEFEVQSYGDGVRWQAAWGPWSGTVEDTTFPAPTLSIAVPDGGLEADGSTDITVNAGDLAPTLAYRLSIGAGVHTGFDAECAAPARSVDLPVQADRTSYAWPLTLHGCSVGTDTLTARLYEVHEEDSETERASTEAQVTVSCAAPDFDGASVTIKPWTEDTPITSFTLPEAMGGCGDLTYTLSPDLPSGVTRDPNTQRISGTPAEAMARTEYTWTAANANGETDALTFFITVQLKAPEDLVIIPLPERSAKLSWDAVTGAFGYGIQVRERYKKDGKVVLGTWNYLGEVIGVTDFPILLDAVWSDQDGRSHGMAALPENGVYQYAVRAKSRLGGDAASAFSKPVEMRDIPMVIDGMVMEANAAEITWPRIDEPNIVYKIHWRKLDGGVSTSWESWSPNEAQPGDWIESEPIYATRKDTARRLAPDALYAFRLTYEYDGGKGFSAREHYGWPRPADERFPARGARVATFPFYGHWPTKTYGYVFCDETVPSTEAGDWRSLIAGAAKEWNSLDDILLTGDRPFVAVNPSQQVCEADDNLPHSLFTTYLDNVNEIFMVDLDAYPNHPSGSMTERIAEQSEIDLGCVVLPTRENIAACIFQGIGQAVFSPLGTIGCILVADSCAISYNLHDRNAANAAGDLRRVGRSSVDIAINARTTADPTRRPPDLQSPRTWTLDTPSFVRFNTCQGSGNFALFRMMVHEFGHALGLSSLIFDRPSGDFGALEPEPHSTVPNSVLNEIEEADCSPYPFDILALQALYQGVP